MALEKVVRPFQLRSNTLPVPVQLIATVDPKPVELKIGSSGSGKTLEWHYTMQESFYCDQASNEFGDGIEFSGAGSPFGGF